MKTERFEMRFSKPDKALIIRAAKKGGVSIAQFVRDAAVGNAKLAVAK